MRTTHSPEPWARRHRLQHDAFLKGKTLAVDPRVSKRFAREFEDALRQRGAIAKEVMMLAMSEANGNG